MSLLQEISSDVDAARSCLAKLHRSLNTAGATDQPNEDEVEGPIRSKLDESICQQCTTDCAAVVNKILTRGEKRRKNKQQVEESGMAFPLPLLSQTESFESILCQILHAIRMEYSASYSQVHDILPDDRVRPLKVEDMQVDSNTVAEFLQHIQGTSGSPTWNRTQSLNDQPSNSSHSNPGRPSPPLPSGSPAAARPGRRSRPTARGSYEQEDEQLQFDEKGRPILPEKFIRQRALEEARAREQEAAALVAHSRSTPRGIVNHPFATEEFKVATAAPKIVRATSLQQQSSQPSSGYSRFPSLVTLRGQAPAPTFQSGVSQLPGLGPNGQDDSTIQNYDDQQQRSQQIDLASLAQSWISVHTPPSWTHLLAPSASGEFIRRRECILASLTLLATSLSNLTKESALERSKARAALTAHECADLRVRALELELDVGQAEERTRKIQELEGQVSALREQLAENENASHTLLFERDEARQVARTLQAKLDTPVAEETVSVDVAVQTDPAPVPIVVPVAVTPAAASSPISSSPAHSTPIAAANTSSDLLDSKSYILELETQLSQSKVAQATLNATVKDLRKQLQALHTKESEYVKRIKEFESAAATAAAEAKLNASKKPTAPKAPKPKPPAVTASAPTVDPAVTAALATAQANEKSLQEKLDRSEKKCKTLTVQVTTLTTELTELKTALETAKSSLTKSESTYQSELKSLTTKSKADRLRLAEQTKQIVDLESQLQGMKEKLVAAATSGTSSIKENSTDMNLPGLEDESNNGIPSSPKSPSPPTQPRAVPGMDYSAMFFRLQKQYESLEARHVSMQEERKGDALRHANEMQRILKEHGITTGSTVPSSTKPAVPTTTKSTKGGKAKVATTSEDDGVALAKLNGDFSRQKDAWLVEKTKLTALVESTEVALGKASTDVKAKDEEIASLVSQVGTLQRRLQQLASTPSQPITPGSASVSVSTPDASCSSTDQLSRVLAEQTALKKKFNLLHGQCSEALRKLKLFEMNCQCDALKDQHSKMRKAILDAFSTE